MEQKQASAGSADLARFLEERLRQSGDGAITVSKQAGKVSHLTLTESRGSPGKARGSAEAQGGVRVTDAELSDIIQDIESVEYGTVVLRMKDSIIIGVEKNESIKL